MSSTNRGAERRLDDAYMTPAWCVRRLLDVWRPGDGFLVEPCVGDGAIVMAFDAACGKRPWWTYDVREVAGVPSTFHHTGDFLSLQSIGAQPSAVITNPPYSLAEEFLRHSRALCPRAELAFLLRMAFAASAKRLPLWRCLGTPDMFVLPNRPSFTGKGTDSADYAWFVWPAEVRSSGRLIVLPETPAEERKS